jgi:uncharacterized protein YlxW (UPF0749 family)
MTDDQIGTGATGGRRRPDASMTLITSMLERPLDPGYQQAADRREAQGLPRATSYSTALVIILAVLTGFLFALAALSLRPKPMAAAQVKAQLVARIEGFQKQASAQDAKVAVLTRQVRDYEALALKQSGSSDLSGQIAGLEVQAGTVGLTGPGLTLTIDDAASTEAGGGAGSRPSSGFEPGRVTSADLQIIVNGLWGAGAEAISINGHRLSSTAAIRFAGQAIIVDFRPLARPYVITALGDGTGMQQLFDQAFAGVYLSQLTQEFKIRSVLKTADALSVPADSASRLEVARPITPAGSVPSTSSATTTQRKAAPGTAPPGGATSGAGTGTDSPTTAPPTTSAGNSQENP